MKVDLFHAPPTTPHPPLSSSILQSPRVRHFFTDLTNSPQAEAHCLLLLLQPMVAIVLPFLPLQPALLLRSFICLELNTVRQCHSFVRLFK